MTDMAECVFTLFDVGPGMIGGASSDGAEGVHDGSECFGKAFAELGGLFFGKFERLRRWMVCKAGRGAVSDFVAVGIREVAGK